MPALIGVSILVFSMLHLIPGDPALAILGEHANKSNLESFRKDMGLDKPLLEQYFSFVGKALSGDFGRSFKTKQPVIDEFKERFGATLELSFVAMFFAVVFGIAVGVTAAVKRNGFFDYGSMAFALAGVSMPVFWLGLVLIYTFSVNLGWFPVSGRIGYEFYVEKTTGFYLIDTLIDGDADAFWDALKHLVLPAVSLGTIPMAIIARMTRSSMIEVLKEDYIKTARAKGCGTFRVVFIHALRNAIMPVITVIGLMLGGLFAGAILTETTFSWPGVGKWFVNAVYQRDFPIIQSTTLIIACMFIMINLAVDILYAFINPKIRLR